MSRKRIGAWVELKVGSPVRGPRKARIQDSRPGIARGRVFLDRPLDGFRWWNKADLKVTTPPKKEK